MSPRLSQTLATSLISVAIALFGATASLFGVWLGNHNASQVQQEGLRHEDQVAEENIRREAYENFIAAVSKYRGELVTAQNAQRASRSPRAATASLEREYLLANERFVALSIVGSRRVSDLAYQVVVQLTKASVLESGKIESITEDDWSKLYFDWTKASNNLLSGVRTDLGIRD